MSEAEANKAIVERFFNAVEIGDVATLEELHAPDCTWWVLGLGELSREGYLDAVKGMLLTASSRKVEIVSMVAEGDSVAAELRSEMKFGDRTYANEYHDLMVIRGGLLVHGREYFDTARATAFFGPTGES